MALITVDEKKCSRCGICSDVCTGKLIEAADEKNLPFVPEEKEVFCIRCGHCEAFCPGDALKVNIRPEDKVSLPKNAGTISPEELGLYLKNRRSIRHFRDKPVSKDEIMKLIDIASYAPSGCNGQPVEWNIYDSKKVKRIAELTIEWMKTLVNTPHPMSDFAPGLIDAWESGNDVICRGAPHLLIAHIPEDNPIAPVDGIIALTYFDASAQAFGIGTCWAGFVAGAAMFYEPLQKELEIPKGRKCAYPIMFGYPKYKPHGIPRRNIPKVKWV